MIYTKDKLLNDYRPSNVSFDDFLEDCKRAIDTPEVHSDEYSSEDEVLAQEERENKKRPDHILNTNSVIKVFNKPWRSSQVCEVANYYFLKYITFIYNNKYIFFIIRLKKSYTEQKKSA